MNIIHLVLLAWAFAATAVILFIYGAAIDDGGHKARREAEQRDAWTDRIASGQ
ncbi:hypothetical protein [Caballeronia sp. DA-9]|uniref:hypothetical protein n=1 Tax=Caballeronia sp. DA-9 TaxID=3436237 RepID=UPI003F67C4FB